MDIDRNAAEGNPRLTPLDDSALRDHKVRQVELLISNLLRVGVGLSLTIVVFGLLVTFIHHPIYLSSKTELKRLAAPGAAFPHTLADVWRGLREFRGLSIVTLGLLLLIITPVVRVAVSIFAFVYERDRTFVIITSIVLILLLLSFFLGKAGG